MMYNCRDILLFNKYSAMVGDNEKLMLCYLLSFSSVLPKLLLDKSPYKNVNKITRQIISVQNMGPNFCDPYGSLPLTLCFGKVRIISSQHHSLNFSTSPNLKDNLLGVICRFPNLKTVLWHVTKLKFANLFTVTKQRHLHSCTSPK